MIDNEDELYNQLVAARDSGQMAFNIDQSSPQGAPSGASSPGFFEGMSEAGSHAVESMAGGWNATMSELYKDAGQGNISKYKEALLKKNLASMQDMESRMGMGAQIASGVIQSVPTIAPMVMGGPATLGARMLATGGTSFGQNTGNILLEQERMGQERDLGTASKYGFGQAVLDTGLSMLPTHLAKGVAGRTAADAASGAASATQQQVLTNLATGKDWNEGVGMQSVVGGLTGASMSMGMSGINKAMGVDWNQAGKEAVSTIQRLGTNKNIDPSFKDDYVEYTNLSQDLSDQISRERPGSDKYNELVKAKTSLDRKALDRVAMAKATDIAEKAGVKTDDSMYNYTNRSYDGSGRTYNAADALGIGYNNAKKAAQTVQKAHLGFGTRDAGDKGLTMASNLNQFQVDMKRAIGSAEGTIDYNGEVVTKKIAQMKEANKRYENNMEGGEPLDQIAYDQLTALQSYMTLYKKSHKEFLSNKEIENFEGLEDTAANIYRLADSLGLTPELKGIDGKKGAFNPLESLIVLDQMYKQAHAKMPNFSMGHFDPVKESVKGGFTAGDAAMTFGTSGAWLAAKAARGVIRPLEALRSQKNLQKQMEAGSSISGLTGNLNEIARAKRMAKLEEAEAKVQEAEANVEKVSSKEGVTQGEIDAAQSKVAAANARVKAAEADVVEGDAVAAKEVQDKADSDAAARERDSRTDATARALANADLEGAANAAQSSLSQTRQTTPSPQPSVFDSDVTLAGATRRPENSFKPTKSEEEVSNAQAKAEQDSQAAIEAAQRVEQLKAMVTQPKQLEGPTGIPAKPTKEELDIIEAQQRADLATQQAEQSRRDAEMLAQKQAANSALVQQQNALTRAGEQKRAQAEEQARQEAEALAAQQPVVEQAPKERVPVPKIKTQEDKVQAIKDAEEALEAVENNPDSTWSDIREAESVLESVKSAPVPVKKPEIRKEEPTPEVETPKRSPDQGVVKQPTPSKKPVEDTSPEVEPTTPPKAEEPTQASSEPSKPKVTAFDLARKVNKEKIRELNNLTQAEIQKTPSLIRERNMLQQKERKINEAYDTFMLKHGRKHRKEDIDQVFSEFSEKEILGGKMGISDVNAKLQELYTKQAKEAQKFRDSIKVPEEKIPVKTKEEVEQENISSAWKAVDDLADLHNITPAEIDAAIRSLGTSRDRPIKPETVVRKAIADKIRAESKPLPKNAPKTYSGEDALTFMEGLITDTELTKPEVKKLFNRYLSAYEGPISEAKLQDVVSKMYTASENKLKDLASQAREEAANDRRAAKEAKSDSIRAAAEARRVANEKKADELRDKAEQRRKDAAKAKALSEQRKKDQAVIDRQDAEAKKLAEAQAKLDQLADQKKAALDFLKRKNVNNFRIKEFERDFLNNMTKPLGDNVDAVNMAKNWMNEKSRGDSKKVSDSVNKKIAQVEENVRKMLEERPVQNINILFEGMVDNKLKGSKSSGGSLDRIAEQLGTFLAVADRLSGEAKSLNDALIDAYQFALKAKQDHPDNPEKWLSYDLYNATRDALIGASNSGVYHGRVGVGIRNDIFGSTKSRDFFSDDALKKMNEEAKESGPDFEVDTEGMVVKTR